MREVTYCNFVGSPIGKIGVVFTDKQVLRIELGVKKRNFLKMVEKDFGCGVKIKKNPLYRKFAREISEYFTIFFTCSKTLNFTPSFGLGKYTSVIRNRKENL